MTNPSTSSIAPLRRDAGVAFILVLSVLLGLLILAAPFLTVALNDVAVSETAIADAQAEAGASSIIEYATHQLERTTEPSERARGGDPEQDIFASPDWDTAAEFDVNVDLLNPSGQPMMGSEQQPLLFRHNARGEIWDLKVRDEQTWPHLWSAPPFLIAASLGRSYTAGALTPDDATVTLEDGNGFPLANGAMWIDGERITYAKREGATFSGCVRGTPGGGKNRKHKEETFAFDDRAREIAMLPFRSPRAKEGWREPLSPSAMKEVSLFGNGVLSAIETDKLSREFVTRSWRISADAFGSGQTLLGPIDPAADTTDGFRIQVRGNDGINAGTIVRITDGVNTEYGFVVNSQRRGTNGVITLAEPTRNAYAESSTSIAPLVRHPVNINTASRDTLLRVLTGVQVTRGTRDAGKQGRVTQPSAELVADAIIGARPVKNLEQFRDLLISVQKGDSLGTFDQFQMVAVFRNAVDANDWSLGGSTVPFDFRSHDYYRIKSAAIVNDKSGRERARREITELVHVASPGLLRYRLDSQADFEEPIIRARMARFTTTYPNPVDRIDPQALNQNPISRVQRMLVFAGQDERKGVFGHPTEGDVRLAPVRLPGFNGYTEHFDGQAYLINDNVDVAKINADGWDLKNGPYRLQLRNSGQGGGGGGGGGGGERAGNNRFTRGGNGGGRGRQQGGSFVSQAGANPVKFDMWYRPEGAAGGRQVFLDIVGNDPDQHITLSRENDGTIQAKVHDRTIQDQVGGFEEACVTVFTPPPGLWKDNTWYNVGMFYRGCKPEEVGILWDGFKRGESRFQSVLVGSLSKTDSSFSIERADEWPNHGVCWVGREAVEFQRAGTNFTVIQYPDGTTTGRGRRGTYPIDHAAGEVVQLLGYSTTPKTADDKGGIAIPRGGAKLASDLGPFTVAQFLGNATETLPINLPGIPPLSFDVHDPQKPNGNQLQLTSPGGGVVDYSGFQTTGGYIIIMSISPGGLPGGVTVPAAQAELCWYSSRSGNTLLGLQSVGTPPNNALPANGTIGNFAFTTTRTKHYLRRAGGGPNTPYYCAVFPISVVLNGTQGYLKPQARQGGGQYTNYPEFLSLGVPDYVNISAHKVEWIAYYHIDEARHAFLCDEAPLLEATMEAIRAVLGAQAGGQLAALARNLAVSVLHSRGQEGTDMFGYVQPGSGDRHTTNEDVTPAFHVSQYQGIGFIPPTTTGGQSSPVPGSPISGWGDSVTVEAPGGAIRKRFDVAWSKNGRVAFGQSTAVDFTQARLPGDGTDDNRERFLRLLKFPSGELPIINGPSAKGLAGGDLQGGSSSSGHIDEIRVAPFEAERFVLWDQQAMGLNAAATQTTNTIVQGIDEAADQIPVCNAEWLLSPPTSAPATPRFVVLPDGRQVYFDQELSGVPNNDAGLVQIDDELIAFRSIGSGKGGGPALLQCERGFMGTTAQKHGYGTNVVFWDFLPTTMLNNALTGTGRQLDVASTGGFATAGGLIMIDRELIHYTELVGQAIMRMPPVLDEKGEEKGGMFRGRFGTTAQPHDANAIVVELPFRYWDRWAESQDNPEFAYYGFAVNAPGAYFDSFGYAEKRPSPNVQIVTLVRTEQDVPWTTDPTRRPASLLRFEDGLENKQFHPIKRHGSSFEVRFYFRYLANSFDPIQLTQHDWKLSPELHWAEVKYYDETQVLSRESFR